MKIKIKYQLKGQGANKGKSYTKTFSEVNDQASKDNFDAFAKAYLRLYENQGEDIAYSITKTNEEIITENIA